MIHPRAWTEVCDLASTPLYCLFFIAHSWRSMTIHHWLLHILLNRRNNSPDPMLLHDIIKLCRLLSFWSRDPWRQKRHSVFCNNLSHFKPCNCPQCKKKWHPDKLYEELKFHQKRLKLVTECAAPHAWTVPTLPLSCNEWEACLNGIGMSAGEQGFVVVMDANILNPTILDISFHHWNSWDGCFWKHFSLPSPLIASPTSNAWQRGRSCDYAGFCFHPHPAWMGLDC